MKKIKLSPHYFRDPEAIGLPLCLFNLILFTKPTIKSKANFAIGVEDYASEILLDTLFGVSKDRRHDGGHVLEHAPNTACP